MAQFKIRDLMIKVLPEQPIVCNGVPTHCGVCSEEGCTV